MYLLLFHGSVVFFLFLFLQLVARPLAGWRTKVKPRPVGLRVPLSCFRWSLWCWWQRLTTGARRSSSVGCRVALNRSRSSQSSARVKWFRSLWLRSWWEILRRSNTVWCVDKVHELVYGIKHNAALSYRLIMKNRVVLCGPLQSRHAGHFWTKQFQGITHRELPREPHTFMAFFLVAFALPVVSKLANGCYSDNSLLFVYIWNVCLHTNNRVCCAAVGVTFANLHMSCFSCMFLLKRIISLHRRMEESRTWCKLTVNS